MNVLPQVHFFLFVAMSRIAPLRNPSIDLLVAKTRNRGAEMIVNQRDPIVLIRQCESSSADVEGSNGLTASDTFRVYIKPFLRRGTRNEVLHRTYEDYFQAERTNIPDKDFQIGSPTQSQDNNAVCI